MMARGSRDIFDVSLTGATSWMVGMGALALRTDPELIMKSRRVIPGRLLEAGLVFDYPSWPRVAGELEARWQSGG